MVGMDDELMEIGRFAAATGLSVPALRHYDDVGILKPAEVDVRTSYWRYHPRQIIDARRICSLRGIDLPIEELRRIWPPTTTTRFKLCCCNTGADWPIRRTAATACSRPHKPTYDKESQCLHRSRPDPYRS